jgi:uncharacterized membrane protein YfcA
MTWPMLGSLVVIGVLIGVVGGMLGIGGGVLVIPALVAFFGFEHEKAVGTSLGMLLPPIGIFAFLTYYRHGNVDVTASLLLAIGFAAGAFFGAKAVNFEMIPADRLRLFFAFFLLYVASSIIFRHSDHRVWAVTKTAALMAVFAIAYLGARLIGTRLKRSFSMRETFVSGLQQPLAPDYEI